MAFITLGTSSQLQIQIPIKGTTGWSDELRAEFFQKLVEHDHSGNGKGATIGPNALGPNVVTGTNIKLSNDQFLRSRNAADNNDIDILKVNGSNLIELGVSVVSLTTTGNVEVGGTLDVTGNTNLTGTLDVAGKTTVNAFNLTPVSADPSSPAEGDLQYADGTARAAGPYVYTSGAWVPVTPPSPSTPVKTIKRTNADVTINGITELTEISFLEGNLGNNNTYEVLVEGVVIPGSEGALVTFSATAPYTDGGGTTTNDNISFGPGAPFTGSFSFRFRFTTQNTMGGQPYSGNLILRLSRVGGSLNSTLGYSRAEITEVGPYTEGNF